MTAPARELSPFWVAALASPDTPADVKAHAQANIDAGREVAIGANGYADHVVLWWAFTQGFTRVAADSGLEWSPREWYADPDVKASR